MMSLPLTFTPASSRVFVVRATKSAGGGSEEKSFFDWLGGLIAKEDQLLETDPILKKVEKKGTTGTGSKKGTVEVPQKKKNGGFGGLFAKQ
ncbi:unnamed protein product [Rhodiola kirilowii]